MAAIPADLGESSSAEVTKRGLALGLSRGCGAAFDRGFVRGFRAVGGIPFSNGRWRFFGASGA